MRAGSVKLLLCALFLGACETIPLQDETVSAISIPDEVVAVAGPNQDLTSARLLPEDNCFWYEHRGIVETTLLPLRAANGAPICVAQSS
jgi:hypothetical protein